MQQVGAEHFATAQAVDPRQLPVPVNNLSRKALIGVTHAWVLHRKVMLQAFAATLVLFGIVGLYEARDSVAGLGRSIERMVQGEFAAAGFGISRIEISGQNLTSDENIATMIALASGSSTINFDVQKAMARLNWLRAIDHATVRKVYPDRIIVELDERQPLLRWRIGDATYLVDSNGVAIARDTGSFNDLPLVVGDGANDDALIMINSLNRHETLKKDLAALSRIGDRRWDLIYYSGLRVQLPEQGVAQALDHLEQYQRDYALLDRDVTLVDLRVPGVIALKPGELAAQQLADAGKDARKKHATKGSSEYETPAERTADKKQQ